MMWDDTTPRAKEIGRWLDSPMDLDEFYGTPARRSTLAHAFRRLRRSWLVFLAHVARRA